MSGDAGAQQVVDVDQADGAVVFDDENAGDALVVHQGQGLGRQGVGGEGVGAVSHGLADKAVGEAGAEGAAKVAVGQRADQVAGLVDDAGDAEAFGGHLDDAVAERGGGADQGEGGAGVHELGHVQEAGAEFAAGVEALEVVGGEAALFQQEDGERVAGGELHGGAGGGRQAVGAGFLADGQGEADGGGGAKGAFGAGGERDEGDLEAGGVGDDVGELGSFAGPGEGEHRVGVADHAEVAVAGFGGVDEVGGGAGGGEGGGDLAADMAGFAHAGDNCAGGGAYDAGGVRETGGQSGLQRVLKGLQTLLLELDGFQEGGAGVVHGGGCESRPRATQGCSGMRVLALTGSIGMGKSFAAGILRRAGVPVFDADAAVHRLQAPGGRALAAIGAAFPGTVQAGRLDRAALRAAVIPAPARLRVLEGILHPMVRAEQLRFLARARGQGRGLVALDIPLLFETGGERQADVVMVVSAPRKVQEARIRRRRRMSEAHMAQVISQQMPDAEKRRRADVVIRTGLSRFHAMRAIRRWLAANRRTRSSTVA